MAEVYEHDEPVAAGFVIGSDDAEAGVECFCGWVAMGEEF